MLSSFGWGGFLEPGLSKIGFGPLLSWMSGTVLAGWSPDKLVLEGQFASWVRGFVSKVVGSLQMKSNAT